MEIEEFNKKYCSDPKKLFIGIAAKTKTIIVYYKEEQDIKDIPNEYNGWIVKCVLFGDTHVELPVKK